MTRRVPWPQASTRLVALLGWPARHSLSPLLHNASFQEQDLDLAYVALPTPPEQLRTVVTALGATGAVGANVTVPHKRTVMAICDRLTDEAEAVGAVNTLSWTADGLVGDNTDAAGLEQVLREDVAVEPGAQVVVLGTGGAARALVVAAGRLGCVTTVVGRRAAAAEDLVQAAGSLAASEEPTAVDLADDPAVDAAVDGADLVVNATPLGMHGEALPDRFMRLRPGQIAYDVVYTPPDTPFLVAARAAGAVTHHGLGMLIAQAGLSYRQWTGREAPLATMSAVAAARIATEAAHDSPSSDVHTQ